MIQQGQSLQRKLADKAYQSIKRARESHDETLYRQAKNQMHTATKRASQTSAETADKSKTEFVWPKKR